MNMLLNVIDLVRDARGHAEAGQAQDVAWLLEAIEADLLALADPLPEPSFPPPEPHGQDRHQAVSGEPVPPCVHPAIRKPEGTLA